MLPSGVIVLFDAAPRDSSRALSRSFTGFLLLNCFADLRQRIG
jgi:hypothetical protein